jgi:integrase
VQEHLNPVPLEQSQIVQTIEDGLTKWVAIQKTRIKKDSLRKIKDAFVALLPVSTYNLKDTHAIRAEILKNLAEYSGSNNTKHKYLAWIRQFFAFCIEEEYCELNPVKKSMFPKQTPVNREAFSQAEMAAILEYFTIRAKTPDKHLFVLLLRFLMLTGVRIAEALSIEWQDVNESRIFVRHGKGGYQREIPLAPFPELRAVLQDLQKFNSVQTVPSGKLFYWKAYAKLELWLRKGLREMNIRGEGRNFHSIRKMFENKMLNEMKLPAHIVAQIIGHTVAVQQKHYLKALSLTELTETMANFADNSGQNRDKNTGKKWEDIPTKNL